MKDNKVERVRQEVAMFRRQFLQDDTGAFDQALGNQEITAVVSELVALHRERIYPHWTRYACLLAKFCRLTEPARMWWAAVCPSGSHKANR